MSENTPSVPGLTACALCAGDTLGDTDQLPGGQLERLRDLDARGCTRLTAVECLDVCETDVVVVRPSPAGRRNGGRPVWFSGLAGTEATDALERWLAAGGPGRADVPTTLRPLVVRDPATVPASEPAH